MTASKENTPLPHVTIVRGGDVFLDGVRLGGAVPENGFKLTYDGGSHARLSLTDVYVTVSIEESPPKKQALTEVLVADVISDIDAGSFDATRIDCPCGRFKHPHEAKFCAYCGKKLDGAADTTPSIVEIRKTYIGKERLFRS